MDDMLGEFLEDIAEGDSVEEAIEETVEDAFDGDE